MVERMGCIAGSILPARPIMTSCHAGDGRSRINQHENEPFIDHTIEAQPRSWQRLVLRTAGCPFVRLRQRHEDV
jgi:hypothetical protein